MSTVKFNGREVLVDGQLVGRITGSRWLGPKGYEANYDFKPAEGWKSTAWTPGSSGGGTWRYFNDAKKDITQAVLWGQIVRST